MSDLPIAVEVARPDDVVRRVDCAHVDLSVGYGAGHRPEVDLAGLLVAPQNVGVTVAVLVALPADLPIGVRHRADVSFGRPRVPVHRPQPHLAERRVPPQHVRLQVAREVARGRAGVSIGEAARERGLRCVRVGDDDVDGARGVRPRHRHNFRRADHRHDRRRHAADGDRRALEEVGARNRHHRPACFRAMIRGDRAGRDRAAEAVCRERRQPDDPRSCPERTAGAAAPAQGAAARCHRARVGRSSHDRRHAARESGDRRLRKPVGRRSVPELASVVTAPARGGPARCHRTRVGSASRHRRHASRQPGHRRRHGPVRRRPVTYLALAVISPALHGPARQERARVSTPRRDRQHAARQAAHRHRRQLVLPRPVAHLPIIIVTPALHRPGRHERARVAIPRHDLRHAAVQPGHRHLGEVFRVGPVPELAVAVVAPASGRAADGDRAGVHPAGRDRRRAAREPAHRGRRQLVLEMTVPELARGVVAPAPGRAARCQRAGMVLTRRHGQYAARQAAHPNRCRPVNRCRVPDLAVGVGAPAPRGAAGGHRARVGTSRRSRREGCHAARQAARRRWRQPVHDRPVSQLAIVVVAPARHLAARRHGARMASAGGDRRHAAREPGRPASASIRFVVVPSPTAPYSFWPQHDAAPPDVTAQV